MVVKIINGMRIHEPPYIQAEEDEFYSAPAAARLLSRAQLVTVKSRRPQNSSSRRRQNRTALKSLSRRSIQPCPWPIILRAFWMSSRGAAHFADVAASAEIFWLLPCKLTPELHSTGRKSLLAPNSPQME